MLGHFGGVSNSTIRGSLAPSADPRTARGGRVRLRSTAGPSSYAHGTVSAPVAPPSGHPRSRRLPTAPVRGLPPPSLH
ncbi:hypothetical protein FM112_05795 [Gulosibacter sp. 10]|nr:hypothetical protein FM112_05795 [Gulosibacter sp. 10]